MRLSVLAFLPIAIALGCAGSSCSHNNPRAEGSTTCVGSSCGASSTPADRGDASDAGAACEDAGMGGVRYCCGRADDVPGDTCLPRPAGDASRGCTPEGKMFDGRRVIFGEGCCAGLTEVEPLVVVDAGQPSGVGLPDGC